MLPPVPIAATKTLPDTTTTTPSKLNPILAAVVQYLDARLFNVQHLFLCFRLALLAVLQSLPAYTKGNNKPSPTQQHHPKLLRTSFRCITTKQRAYRPPRTRQTAQTPSFHCRLLTAIDNCLHNDFFDKAARADAESA